MLESVQGIGCAPTCKDYGQLCYDSALSGASLWPWHRSADDPASPLHIHIPIFLPQTGEKDRSGSAYLCRIERGEGNSTVTRLYPSDETDTKEVLSDG